MWSWAWTPQVIFYKQHFLKKKIVNKNEAPNVCEDIPYSRCLEKRIKQPLSVWDEQKKSCLWRNEKIWLWVLFGEKLKTTVPRGEIKSCYVRWSKHNRCLRSQKKTRCRSRTKRKSMIEEKYKYFVVYKKMDNFCLLVRYTYKLLSKENWRGVYVKKVMNNFLISEERKENQTLRQISWVFYPKIYNNIIHKST